LPVILTLPVIGRTKRDIIEMMREFCGQAGFEFELSPEEVASDLRLLDTMMAEWPWKLTGYARGNSLPDEPSGLAEEDVPAVFMELALRRAPALGKSMGPEARSSMGRSYTALTARYSTILSQPLAPNTVRGSGAPWGRRVPFINESAT
jgi:hypothetical protein